MLYGTIRLPVKSIPLELRPLHAAANGLDEKTLQSGLRRLLSNPKALHRQR
jgi:hypothetical protein